MLEAQKNALINLIKTNPNCSDIIFLGDMSMHRKPEPLVLLALKEVFDFITKKGKNCIVLRGNHDSNNKSDDGVTYLTLYENEFIKVVHEEPYYDELTHRYFIPHYENLDRIREALNSAPEGALVFGHFGYVGSYNSQGDEDSDVSIEDFKNDAILGHIHNYALRTNSRGCNVLIPGTPWSTSFGEANTSHYVHVLDKNNEIIEAQNVDYAPNHSVLSLGAVRDWWKIVDRRPFHLLRVRMANGEQSSDIPDIDVGYLDIRYEPAFSEEDLSLFSPDADLLTITDDTIMEYIDATQPPDLTRDDLLSGYRTIKGGEELPDED
jgi:DNA repair exonuclease SbcCD nuclease subunit